MSNDLDEATRLLNDLMQTIKAAIPEAKDEAKAGCKMPCTTRRKLRLVSQP